MGCNIRAHIEYRARKRPAGCDRWDECGVFRPRPNYNLFGELAGVCCALPPDGVPPRGVPTDVSRGVDVDWANGQAIYHNPSWLTPDEWKRALRIVGPYQEPAYHAILAAMRALESTGNEVRVVFWFKD